ncbi:MAG TPA: helix-turn-helix transcriptional regulator [Acidimicrobiales bacterium]|nr:helix-turn-helix transcriptional regulator [Acidimicrobiales bacterium]
MAARSRPAGPAPDDELKPRDVMVLRLLSEGYSVADIAQELDYAESTIKREVHLIVRRLGARNRTHAVAMAVRASFI